MYSNPHAAVSLSITTTALAITKDINTAYIIGLPLAVLSHWVLDFLKEGNLGDDVNKYDIYPSWLYYLCGFLTGHFWFFLFSWIAGNLLDIIDKKLYFVIAYPKIKNIKVIKSLKKNNIFNKIIKYLSVPTYYFHKHKTGIQFTKKQTKVASIISTIVILIISIFINKIG